ncbi:PhaM family polyhydroxyalkanoate granule multifunctional regulatory protein [Undibacterium arcticum]|uniref:PhaM family polyhydroxyalkanoate granule multifunctional regulatory protein n=1 Tax=Undibacterium arcticum TaxID=1762892 RepID=A0ABV7F0R8_9BURK
MTQPSMPEMPGAGLMTDTLEFVKNLWGGMNIPGVVVPTVSVDELDKKIGDLKAVESWLNLNMSMLRGSIQALEVQRATIATLKAMSVTLSSTAKPDETDKSGFMSSPFSSAFAFPTAAPAPTPAPAATPAAPAETPQSDATSRNTEQPAAKEKSEQAGPMPDLNAQMVNPAAWWNVLQDQFRQAVSNAVASETAAPKPEKSDKKAASNGKTATKPAGTAQKAATKTKAAPRSKRVSPKA